MSLGLTKLIKDKNKVEASLFYEKSPGLFGKEQLGMQLVVFVQRIGLI